MEVRYFIEDLIEESKEWDNEIANYPKYRGARYLKFRDDCINVSELEMN